LARLKGYEIAVAGGTSLKLWNVLHGKLVRENDTSHSKTITRVFVAPRVGFGSADDEQESRIITSGLDGFVRIYDPSTFNCLHGTRLLFPLLSLAISPVSTGSDPSNRLLVTGSVDGHLLVQQRPRPNVERLPEDAMLDQKRGLNDGSLVSAGPKSDEYIVHIQRALRLKAFQKALRQFRYGDALDGALETKSPQIVCAVLEELSKRRAGLETALSHRDEESLEPILAFCSRYVIAPKFTSLLAGVVHVIVDIYQGVLGQSATIYQLVEKTRRSVRGEMAVQQGLLTLIGELDGIMAVADMKQSFM
jgi:U3 small nucleolar RNA-associated protein 15